MRSYQVAFRIVMVNGVCYIIFEDAHFLLRFKVDYVDLQRRKKFVKPCDASLGKNCL